MQTTNSKSSVSEKQLKANRQNAQLGGVKTDGGKEVSKMNALKHGILSRGFLLRNEDKNEYDEHYNAHIDYFNPEDPYEYFLTETIIIGIWRLKRLISSEKGAVDFDNDSNPLIPTEIAFNKCETLSRYETSLRNSIFQAYRQLKKHREN